MREALEKMGILITKQAAFTVEEDGGFHFVLDDLCLQKEHQMGDIRGNLLEDGTICYLENAITNYDVIEKVTLLNQEEVEQRL